MRLGPITNVHASRNGHMSLTSAGWALVHAMEANNA